MELIKEWWPYIAGALAVVAVAAGIVAIILKVDNTDLKNRASNSVQANLRVNIDQSGVMQLSDGSTIDFADTEQEIKALCIAKAQYKSQFAATEFVPVYDSLSKTTKMTPYIRPKAKLQLGCYEDNVSREGTFDNKNVGDYITVLVRYTVKPDGAIVFESLDPLTEEAAESFIEQGIQELK